MNIHRLIRTTLTAACFALALGGPAAGQDPDDDALKISALEALMTAPSQRALPLVRKVLEGNHSDAVKSRALFVLSQLNGAEAQGLLVEHATAHGSTLQHEAIRMVGIGGSDDALRELAGVYSSGDPAVRDSVLNAYLIAGEADLVYAVARNAADEDEFDKAVQTLAAMRATSALRRLYDERGGDSESLVRAYAIAGDLDSLLRVANESTDIEQRERAIRDIGIVRGQRAGEALVDIYRRADHEDIRDAALHGLLVHGHDEGVLALFRASNDAAEKRRLLQTLVSMNSDLALDIIDSTLEGDN